MTLELWIAAALYVIGAVVFYAMVRLNLPRYKLQGGVPLHGREHIHAALMAIVWMPLWVLGMASGVVDAIRARRKGPK